MTIQEKDRPLCLDFIEVASGGKFYLQDSPPEYVSDIHITDIARALSNTCRYTGHSRSFYSVADHTIIASYICDPEIALEMLMHDASEAYITDVASPFKKHLENYREIEDSFMERIVNYLGLPLATNFHHDPRVSEVDLALLLGEAFYLVPSKGLIPGWPDSQYYVNNFDKIHEEILKHRPGLVNDRDMRLPMVVEELWLKRFKELMELRTRE